MSTGNFSEFQSAYRGEHSTETALLKVVNDVVMSTCDRSTIVLLDISVANFDTVDHSILLDRTSRDFSIHGSALAHSLHHRHQYADDTQLHTAVRPCADANFKSVSMCVEDVARCFLANVLLLNPTKTEAVLFGTIEFDATRFQQRAVLMLLG